MSYEGAYFLKWLRKCVVVNVVNGALRNVISQWL